MLSIENASGLLVRGEGWLPRGSKGRGMLRKGRKRKGLDIGSEGCGGGGEAMVDPDDEWNDEDNGDLGELTEDSGESQTLMIGEHVSRSGSSIFIFGTRLEFDSNMIISSNNHCIYRVFI